MSRLLRDAGEALYGPQWQTQIARDLGMSDRHVRRLAAGAADLSPGMAVDLLRVATERAEQLDTVIDRLRAASTPGSQG